MQRGQPLDMTTCRQMSSGSNFPHELAALKPMLTPYALALLPWTSSTQGRASQSSGSENLMNCSLTGMICIWATVTTRKSHYSLSQWLFSLHKCVSWRITSAYIELTMGRFSRIHYKPALGWATFMAWLMKKSLSTYHGRKKAAAH